MILSKDEFKIDGDNITIHKKTLEKWIDRYRNISHKQRSLLRGYYFAGKQDILTDLLFLILQDDSKMKNYYDTIKP